MADEGGRHPEASYRSLESKLVTSIPPILDALYSFIDAAGMRGSVAQENQASKIRGAIDSLREVRLLLQGNRQQLTRRSTPRFERACSSEEHVPESAEEARVLEGLSRRAQSALQARSEELKRDLDAVLGRSEERLTTFIESKLTCLLVPGDTSVDGIGAAQNHLLKELRLLLVEIRKHRELLHASPLAILEWAEAPDAHIPVTVEEQRFLKERARRAQD